MTNSIDAIILTTARHSENPMITLYHLDNSRSERIVWLLEELALPYEMQTFLREKGAAPAAMQNIHPIGTAPLLRDGELVIMESGAIIEYIINRYSNGRLIPASSSADYVLYLEWLHFAEGALMSNLLRSFIVSMVAKDSPMVQMGAARHTRMFTLIDQHLSKRGYFAGDEFTASDIMIEFCFSFLQRFAKQNIDSYTNIAAWLQTVRARPAYQRMTAVAGPKVQFG